MKFSFIIPAYNVEKYIVRCINSILSIEYEDIEIIIIDDGSTDHTLDIINQYYSKNEKVLIFSRENAGLSRTRNFGIDVASGEYISFIDSDDFINQDSFNIILKCADSKPDVIITRMIEFDEDLNRHNSEISFLPFNNIVHEIDQAVTINFQNCVFTWPAQKLIVSKRLIETNNLRFKENVLHEDVNWTVEIFLVAKRFSYASVEWYYYFISNQNSITKNKNPQRLIDTQTLIISSLKSIENSNIPYSAKEIIKHRLVISLFTNRNSFNLMSKDQKKNFCEVFDTNFNTYKRYLKNNKGIIKMCFTFLDSRLVWNLISRI